MTTPDSPPALPAQVARPIAATIAVVLRSDSVLLVRRANPPDAGRWGFPGGKIDFGETIEAAAVRELLEETGIHADRPRIYTAVDVFDHDASGKLRKHYLLIAALCRYVSGEPLAGDDALDARWFPLDSLDSTNLALSLDVARVAHEGARLQRMVTSQGAIAPPKKLP
ncbi:NUDIX hydrolase [Achromobacter aloeverae]|uniref:ADP-ribose pyrophosphatase n=1 Tax=Achromobacter aloeverae TaxID=1750518 RepID=A0A4Q1HLN9_9BURK|nr:NUDIX hydrolase [Achromobacter aloeverae]RXN91268.1 ADP-ribose pyrophosphatase [Achromobacter aloeverae]